MTPERISFFVPGVPETEGSTKAWVGKSRAIVVHDNPRLHAWRTAVTRAARAAANAAGWEPKWDGPVSVAVTFRLPRPKSAPKSRTLPWVRPDLDKLQRAVGDALAPRLDPAPLLTEDSRIVHWDARKVYVEWEPAGALITITRLDPDNLPEYVMSPICRVLRTAEEIDYLPAGAVVRDARGAYYEAFTPGILETVGTNATYCGEDLPLPVTVIEEGLS